MQAIGLMDSLLLQNKRATHNFVILTVSLKNRTVILMPNVDDDALSQSTASIAAVVLFIIALYMSYQAISPYFKNSEVLANSTVTENK